jgi:hypothetical protein
MINLQRTNLQNALERFRVYENSWPHRPLEGRHLAPRLRPHRAAFCMSGFTYQADEAQPLDLCP